ncbi:hypothetical protein WDV85_07050 [Pseudokineococcus sp. 5B2Z-1]|uniref:hypothetical protein n=1 Tax=Pseudokineococcus sp. 5B2Z-1 TaxID=3132744 RepID=UPI0030ABAE55
MSRDALGDGPPRGGPDEAAGAPGDRWSPGGRWHGGAPPTGRPSPAGDLDGEGDDLDAPPARPGGARDHALPRGSRGGVGGALRRAAALVLAAAVGAGGVALASRGSDPGGARLVSLGAYPVGYGASWGQGDDLSLTMVVGNTGDEDVLVLGGGTRDGQGRLLGEVVPDGRTPVVRREGAEPVAELPVGGTAQVRVVVPGTCGDPPPWEPWLVVRTSSGTAQVPVTVLRSPDIAAAEGADVPDGAFAEACSYAVASPAFTPAVVDQRSTEEGLVLRVRNDADASYVVRVLSGGAAGLALAGTGVVVEPATTTEVLLRADPPSCRVALEAPDLVVDVVLEAVRREGDDGAASVRLDLDPFAAGTAVGLAVGRACADEGL